MTALDELRLKIAELVALLDPWVYRRGCEYIRAGKIEADNQGFLADMISEHTAGAGVTVDGVLLKDNDIRIPSGLYVGATGTAPPDDDIIADGGIYVGRNADPGAGNVAYAGVLKGYRAGTEFTGYPLTVCVPPLSSGSWDGDAKDTGDNGVIDLSAVFGAPPGIKAILARMTIMDETAYVWARLGPSSSYPDTMVIRTQVANQAIDDTSLIPCDSNGDVYWSCQAELDYVSIYIWGYCI